MSTLDDRESRDRSRRNERDAYWPGQERPALRRLHNDDWGFDSNCFVCEPRNDGGLQIPFHLDEVRGVVVATFSLGERFSGAPTYVHGGITLAVMDEAMAWATIAVGGKLAVTAKTSAQFLRPVELRRLYTVEARLTSQQEKWIEAQAEIRDGSDRLCAEASASFAVLAAAQAASAAGTDESAIDPAYLR